MANRSESGACLLFRYKFDATLYLISPKHARGIPPYMALISFRHHQQVIRSIHSTVHADTLQHENAGGSRLSYLELTSC